MKEDRKVVLIDKNKEKRTEKIRKIKKKEERYKSRQEAKLIKEEKLREKNTTSIIFEAVKNFKSNFVYVKEEKNKIIQESKNPKTEKIKFQKIKKCIDCDELFQSRRNRCSKCYNLYQRNVQRDKSSTIEGYLKQLLSSMKSGKTRRTCDISIEELLEMYYNQDGKCALTGIEMTLGDKRNGQNNPYALSIDRIDNNLHYTKENVWLVLRAVNQFKNCYELGDVFKMVRAMYELNGFSNSVD